VEWWKEEIDTLLKQSDYKLGVLTGDKFRNTTIHNEVALNISNITADILNYNFDVLHNSDSPIDVKIADLLAHSVGGTKIAPKSDPNTHFVKDTCLMVIEC